MEESFSIPPEECGDSELDPRIQLELEKLNTATSEINKLELDLDESNTTFRMLLNETTRRLKGLAQKLGSSVDRARPYHEACNAARQARTACQRAAVAFQRASEIHAAAKETVTLAEQRFKSNQHEWQFDSTWQEMLNHATIKVMDADNQKSESGREHQKKAQMFNTAETKLQQLEDQLRKHIIKSRPYFDEKQLCQEQLNTQKDRIEALGRAVTAAKRRYAAALRALEAISEDIHSRRAVGPCPSEPRTPGVGAEGGSADFRLEMQGNSGCSSSDSYGSGGEETSGGLEELRRRVRRLAARPLEGGGARGDSAWESELNATVNRLDQMLMMRERAQALSKDRHVAPRQGIVGYNVIASSPTTVSSSSPSFGNVAILPEVRPLDKRMSVLSVSSLASIQPAQFLTDIDPEDGFKKMTGLDVYKQLDNLNSIGASEDETVSYEMSFETSPSFSAIRESKLTDANNSVQFLENMQTPLKENVVLVDNLNSGDISQQTDETYEKEEILSETKIFKAFNSTSEVDSHLKKISVSDDDEVKEVISENMCDVPQMNSHGSISMNVSGDVLTVTILNAKTEDDLQLECSNLDLNTEIAPSDVTTADRV